MQEKDNCRSILPMNIDTEVLNEILGTTQEDIHHDQLVTSEMDQYIKLINQTKIRNHMSPSMDQGKTFGKIQDICIAKTSNRTINRKTTSQHNKVFKPQNYAQHYPKLKPDVGQWCVHSVHSVHSYSVMTEILGRAIKQKRQ